MLAIRDGVPNFEFVGITTLSTAERETVLVLERNVDYDETVPFGGKMYVEKQEKYQLWHHKGDFGGGDFEFGSGEPE